MTRNYQSLAFFEWLREKVFKIEKPGALPWGEWGKWNNNLKTTRPVAYWLTETLPDWLEKPAEWIIDPVYSVKYYIVNRWIDKTHAMESTLERGKWHEFEERLLYCMFDELVNFVEIEQAWHHIMWSDEDQKKYRAPWYAVGWFRTRTWRSPEAGLAHLKWEQSLAWTEDEVGPDSDMLGKRTHQAERADEIMALYTWWKEVRPNRGDSWDVSGFRAFWNAMDAKYDVPGGERTSWIGFKNTGKTLTDEENAEYDRLQKLEQGQEEAWHTEDEEMMIRLIKLRRSLWT